MSTRSFYNYFKDKNDLLYFLLDCVAKEIVTLNENHYPNWQASIRKLLSYIEENIKIFKVVEKYQGQNSLADSLIAIGLDRTERDMCKRMECKELPEDIKFTNGVFNHFFYNYLTKWIKHDPNLSIDQFMHNILLCVPQILRWYYDV